MVDDAGSVPPGPGAGGRPQGSADAAPEVPRLGRRADDREDATDAVRVVEQRGEPRVWRGIPRAERVQERRVRLLEAGLEVFGTVGVRHATVGAICQQAHLTQRYFYESFPNLKSLLSAVFTELTDQQLERMATAATSVRLTGGGPTEATRAALTSYFSDLQGDRRVARIQLLEILGCDEGADRCYQMAIRRAADLVLHTAEIREVSRPAVPRLLALGMIGAVVEIATMWLLADFADPLDAVVGSALMIFEAVITAERAVDPCVSVPARTPLPEGSS